MNTFERIGPARPTHSINFLSQAPSQFTLAITGQPRGGTTMVAAVVEALGVYLGPSEDLRRFHFEDQTMHQPDLSQVYPCIKERNAQFDKWGWKDPTGMEPIQNLIYALRNPRVIIVFRDMLATCQGEMRFDEAYEYPRRSLEQLMEVVMHRNQQIFSFIRRTQVPTLLVSYERAMEQPRMFLEDAIAFLGLEATQEVREKAIERIGRGYLKM